MAKRQQIILSIALIALFLGSIAVCMSSRGLTATAQAASSPTISEFPTSGSVDGITNGPDRNLWFTDLEADKIGRITPAGIVEEFPLPPTLFSLPGGITTGPDGNLWFTDHASNRIGVISPDGTVVASYLLNYVSGNQSGLTSIVTGPDGNLWFTEDFADIIGRITPSGAISLFPIPSGKSPGGITSGPDGNLWFTDGIDSIGRITPAGNITEFYISADAQPTGITSGPDGNIWFSEYSGGVGSISTSGTNLTVYTVPGFFAAPEDITAGSDGNLWFTDILSNSVGSITPSGQVTEYAVPTAANDVRYITSGPDGNVWFTEANKIGRINLSVPTPTPTSTNPCPPNSPSECLLASNAAYGLDTNSFVAPSSMTMLVRSDYINSSWRSDGFEAVALQDSNGNIIIANEGTLPGISSYDRNTVLSDLQLATDHSSARVLTDAINFAGRVLSAYYGHPGYGEIYVTGHSLGGIEAQAEAKAWGNIAGGATFGASGLPGNATAGGPQNLTNYVDYGDPVGNYASDSNSQLNDHTAGVMYHYGKVELVGSPLNASNLQTAAVTRDAALAPYLEGTGKVKASENQAMLNLCAGINVAEALRLYHSIANYASDLKIALSSTATVPTLNAADIGLTFDEELGTAGLSNLEKTTEQANGTLTSPDTTISSNPQTDQISIRDIANVQESWGTVATGGTTTLSIDPFSSIVSSITYLSPDGSQYLVHIDYNDDVDTIQINPIQGGSYQVTYDTSKSQSWSSGVNIYSRKNEQGTLLETIYNWRAGGSQVQLFIGLPRGDTEELKNYSGPNGTGKLLSISYRK